MKVDPVAPGRRLRSPPKPPPKPPERRERRSHAERTAETRGRILAAVVESIADVGFQRTTASEIARRSGVTWGAVQHHFGGKDGILLAVLERSFDHFAERMAEVPSRDAPLEKRVDAFIDRAWEHFGSPQFRSTFEILLHYLEPEGTDDETSWQGRMFRGWDRIWRAIFGDAVLPRRRRAALQQFTVSALAGIASMRMLEGATDAMRADELAILKRTLLRELTRDAGGAR